MMWFLITWTFAVISITIGVTDLYLIADDLMFLHPAFDLLLIVFGVFLIKVCLLKMKETE